MSNATEQARSTRQDARAFAEAFSAADDAFTFGRDVGESRELSLDELGDVLGLGGGVAATTAPRPSRRPVPVDVREVVGLSAAHEDDLLTLDELGDALARGERQTDDLDFDFGTSANERARRRTAARLGAPMPEARPRAEPTTASSRRAAPSGSGSLAAASAATAARMAGGARLTRGVALTAPSARRTLREIEPQPQRPAKTLSERFGGNPDRIAMWAVLLGILLILIAFTSGSAGA